jgi:hypothetical protein
MWLGSGLETGRENAVTEKKLWITWVRREYRFETLSRSSLRRIVICSLSTILSKKERRLYLTTVAQIRCIEKELFHRLKKGGMCPPVIQPESVKGFFFDGISGQDLVETPFPPA